jgi:DNA polymerase elongation subunit (family B)
VQEIIIKLGYASSIHEKRLHTGNVIYRVTVIKKQLTPTINVKKYNDSWIKYNGKVYCCSVPNQIILVRRNGYPVWCGNSGIKSKGLKSVSAWYGFKALTLGDEVENTQRLIGTQQLREYLISDVEATKVVSDVYLPNAIALAELIQVPLGSIVGCFPSFIPKIICARHCKRLNLVPLDNNKERYGNTKEDDNGKPTGEIEPGRLYTLGSRFQGAIVEARKFGYINNLTKVDFACVDSETELMTDEGWIKANKIKGTEKLLTFNGPSNQLTFQNMDSWNSYDYDGDMIGIQNRYIDQLVTPNHRVCYRDARKENTKWQFKEADKVPTYIKIPVSAFTISHNQIDSAKLKYLSLLPWIITEGNITTNSITISQRYTVNKDNCNMLDIICKELIKEDDLYIRNRKNRPDREYSIRGDSYEHLLFLLNNNPRRIPPWIYHTNFVFRRQFIADLIKGDGHQYTENNPGVYVSKEEDLIDDIQLLCHISGLKALKSEEYTDQRNGCKWFYLHITAESEAHVGLNRKYPKKENLFQKIKYVGKVYCPSIPNTTFMIRRNGKVSITGNSMYPSAIRTWNLGPDTTRITNIKDYTGKYNFYRKGKTMVLDIPDENFKKNIEVTVDMSKTGFLKAEIEKLAAERKRLKDLMKEAKTKAETDAYDSRQIAVKVILNSLFGYMGSAYANYSDMATGLTITGMCRWTSKFVSSLLDSHIVNIDTDGFIVDTVQNVEELNSKIAEYIKNNQGVTSYMILEEEPLIDGFFYRMKNYAVRMIKKGKTIIVKHGVAFKSSKQAAVCDTILDTVCQRTLDRTVQDQFIEATELKKLSQYPLSAFKFRVTFSKDLAGYKNGMSLHRAIGLQVEERLKTKVEEGLQVDYYVTKQPAHCKALQDAFKETRRIKGPYYTISQYVTSAEQLDEQYYLDQIDKLFAIFNWKIEPQLHMFE